MAEDLEGLDIGTRVLCRGELGTIIDASPDYGSGAYWRVKFDNGTTTTENVGSQYIAPVMSRNAFFLCLMRCVAARLLSPETAVRLVELVVSDQHGAPNF